MTFFVYMISATNSKRKKTYVGYTKNIKKRLSQHNTGKGAKNTKGFKWELLYKKKFISKSDAMSYEYNLKKNIKKRKEIYNKNS
jgi:putative endonuclease